MDENKTVLREGGNIAGKARKNIEAKFNIIMSDSRELFKQRIKQLFKEGKYIGVLINTELSIKLPLLKSNLTPSEILNDLRYFLEKGYFRPYDRNSDNIEQITLTAKGQDWLDDKVESIKIERIKLRYNPWIVTIVGAIVATIIAGLILYHFFKIK